MSEPNEDTPPQRFKWRDAPLKSWNYGTCLWVQADERWEVYTFGHCDVVTFDCDPWEVMGQVVGDAYELIFIDNDFDWVQGDPWEPCITDEEYEAYRAKARAEHAMLKAEYQREREKDGER
jgi:hypothetical protein